MCTAVDRGEKLTGSGHRASDRTLEWVWWWNNQRLHAELDYRAPIEAEHEHYAEAESLLEATAPQENN
jgi:NADH:ubiquinone oxidoreductase subunit D